MNTFTVRTILLVAALITTSPCVYPQTAAKTAPSATNTPVGRTASDFTRNTLDGKPIRLSNYRGKLVLLNFWATWCGPCLTEIPRFNNWQIKYAAQGLQVVGVSMDDNAASVQKAARKLQFTYPVVMGDEKLGEQYGGVLGLPISYLIGPDGKVIDRLQGETDLNAFEKRITTLLASQKHSRKTTS
jgi:cytochrome c biogenesis protein CcmG, thiol:disulfide interchange protein DsbE